MERWDDKLWLFTTEEFNKLPDGIELISITGEKAIKGKDYIDMDSRYGYIAYGVENPLHHPESELFLTFKLS